MKFIYYLLLPVLLTGLCQQAQAQVVLQRQVTASTGGSGLAGNILIQYTVGEPVVTTLMAGNILLAQGFHQPELPPLSPGADPIKGYILFPNPAATQVKVQFELLTPSGVTFRLINSAGQQLYQQFQQYGPGQVTIAVPVNRFAAGVYTVMLNIGGKVFFEKLIIQ